MTAKLRPTAAKTHELATYNVQIIGAGVIGLSLAWELARRGQRVQVIDSGDVGRGASWAGAGIFPPAAKTGAIDPFEQLRSISHELHAEWAERLRRETGIDTGYRRCGGIYLAGSNAEAATLAANQFWWDEHGIEFEVLDPSALAALEPQLEASRVHGARRAWLLPDECQLRNPDHLRALHIACQMSGVDFVTQQPIERVTVEDDLSVVSTGKNGKTFRARQACICSGAWARLTLEQLGVNTGIMPVRGQIVMYNCGDQPTIARIINEGHRYLVPRDDGRLLAGSIEEEVGYVCETNDAAIGEIRRWAESTLPTLKQCPVEKTWAGLRPGSFDGLPYMGRVGGDQPLFVAAGHFRSGLHLSCGTAVTMADLMLGQPSTIDLRPFRVARG